MFHTSFSVFNQRICGCYVFMECWANSCERICSVPFPLPRGPGVGALAHNTGELYPDLFWSEHFQYQNITSRAAAGSTFINYSQGHGMQTRVQLTFGALLRMRVDCHWTRDFEGINLSQDIKGEERKYKVQTGIILETKRVITIFEDHFWIINGIPQ